MLKSCGCMKVTCLQTFNLTLGVHLNQVRFLGRFCPLTRLPFVCTRGRAPFLPLPFGPGRPFRTVDSRECARERVQEETKKRGVSGVGGPARYNTNNDRIGTKSKRLAIRPAATSSCIETSVAWAQVVGSESGCQSNGEGGRGFGA